MPFLAVPDAGLHMESSDDGSNMLPMQAFGLTLNDSVIENMIKCAQSGQDIMLSLGSSPTLHYGSQNHRIQPASDSSDYDLYHTNPRAATTKAQRLPNPTMSILKQPTKKNPQPGRLIEKGKAGKPGASAGASSPNSTNLANGTASEAKRGKPVKSTKPAAPKNKAMASVLSSSGTPRSGQASPAMPAAPSPSLNAADAASREVYEKNKDQRSTVVHELAVRACSLEYLVGKWGGSESDLKTTLGKVADLIDGKWSLKKLYWKELDVWNYDYASQEDRQAAIDNAIRQYDKQRLGTTAPEWERLLKKEERGKGIVLSKLQATLAKGNITPVPRISKPDDGVKNESDESSRSKGGEAMARSSSQTGGSKSSQAKRLLNPKKPPTAAKKAAATKTNAKAALKQDSKRVLSQEFVDSSSSEDEAPLASKSKPAERKAEKPAGKPAADAKPKSADTKPSEAKPRFTEKTASEARPKPTHAADVKQKPAEKSTAGPKPKPADRLTTGPKPKPAEKSTAGAKPKPAEKPTAAAKPKPVEKSTAAAKPNPKPIVRAPKGPLPKPATAPAPKKRSREDDDSSSSSGTPLIKRAKTKETPRPVTNGLANGNANGPKSQRPEANPSSRAANAPSGLAYKSKNSTSPVKSSPLASSPPTNASDFDDSSYSEGQGQNKRAHANGLSNGTAAVNGKRKERGRDQAMPPSKKMRISEVALEMALQFHEQYAEYKELHGELSQMDDPPTDRLRDLHAMRQMLVKLKADINREAARAA